MALKMIRSVNKMGVKNFHTNTFQAHHNYIELHELWPILIRVIRYNR